MKRLDFDNLVDDFKDNIDWTNYDNIDDIANLKIAKIFDEIFRSKSTSSLLKTTKEFTKVSSNAKVKQGRLILKAMKYLDEVACNA